MTLEDVEKIMEDTREAVEYQQVNLSIQRHAKVWGMGCNLLA